MSVGRRNHHLRGLPSSRFGCNSLAFVEHLAGRHAGIDRSDDDPAIAILKSKRPRAEGVMRRFTWFWGETAYQVLGPLRRGDIDDCGTRLKCLRCCDFGTEENQTKDKGCP